MPRLTYRSLLRYWGPAIFMLACIVVESTDLASAEHTNGLLYFLLRKFFPTHSASQLWELNLILRKIGHVVGYGLLSATFYRGWRGALRPEPESPTAAAGASNTASVEWHFRFAALAALSAFVVASCDEIHQMFIRSRTGTWWDVLLDTSAAVVAQLLLFFYLRRRTSQPRVEAIPERVGP